MNIAWTAVNPWAALVALLAHMLIGVLWYSPVLFGNAWVRLSGVKKEDIQSSDVNKAMAMTIAWSVVKVYGLALLVGATGAAGVVGGLTLGLLLAVTIVLPSIGINYAFEKKPGALLALTVGNHAAALVVACAILAVWR